MIVSSDSLSSLLLRTYAPLKLLTGPTIEDYLGAIHRFERWCIADETLGTTAVDAITPEDIGRYFVAVMAEGLSAETAAGHRRVLHAVLKLAKKRGYTSIDLDEIPRPKTTDKLPRAWDADEFSRLLSAARRLPGQVGQWPARKWLPALLLTVLTTDWRISTVMGILCAEVDFSRGGIFGIERKTRQERHAVLTEECLSAIGGIWGERKELFGDWLHDRGNRQWKALNKLLKRAIDSAGIPDIGRFHAIRKTATTLIADKLGVEEAARFAGHTDSRITRKHYIDPSKLHRRAISDSLPRFADPDMGQLRLF